MKVKQRKAKFFQGSIFFLPEHLLSSQENEKQQQILNQINLALPFDMRVRETIRNKSWKKTNQQLFFCQIWVDDTKKSPEK